VYTSRPGEWKPDLGDYLGDLTDEVPDNRIIEFITGGPKNYAYKIARPDKDGNTSICKVRGISLNYKNSLTINFDTIKDMVINNRDDVKTVRDDYKISREHKRLLTVHQDKDYRIVFDKESSCRTTARDRTDFKRVVSPVMADIWKQIIPAIEQKSQNSDNWFRCTEQTYK
jgi:hypothetical protein